MGIRAGTGFGRFAFALPVASIIDQKHVEPPSEKHFCRLDPVGDIARISVKEEHGSSSSLCSQKPTVKADSVGRRQPNIFEIQARIRRSPPERAARNINQPFLKEKDPGHRKQVDYNCKNRKKIEN